MYFKNILCAAGLASMLMAASTPCLADWAQASDVRVVRPMPAFLSEQAQNPPSFTWPRYGTVPGYVLELSLRGAVVATYTTVRNFYLPSATLAAGSYTWRVRPSNNLDWSTPRSFVILTNAKPFVVPESSVLLSRTVAHGRSRQLTKPFVPYSSWTAKMIADRGASFNSLVSDVTSGIGVLPEFSDALWMSQITQASGASSIEFDMRAVINPNSHQLEAAALLYRLTGEKRYLAEAIYRGDMLASLDPNGLTGNKNSDTVDRTVTLCLLKAADFLWDDLGAERRDRWLASVTSRTENLYADLMEYDGRLDEAPYDSHGAISLGYLALIATLTVGDVPAAQKWFDFAVRDYIHSVYIWGGAEGGHANGTPYALYDIHDSLHLWGVLKEATGVNLYDKPWAMGTAQMFMHFVPPNAPGFVFGDSHEGWVNTSVLKTFAARVNTPEAAWYASNLTGSEDPLMQLESPYPLVPVTSVKPIPPANAKLYPSIGWVAMHSLLSNTLRTSTYFKASPFGSYNHGHGDQNSIVIDSGGRRLLTEAGYNDYYGSDLWSSWYRTTRAHNAVTFDGGNGQVIDSVANLGYNGKITAFSTSSSMDYAAGDATAAYGGKLTSALRNVWYFRTNNAVVVLDKLKSIDPHLFEWNMHAVAPFVLEGVNALKITNGTESLCIRSLTSDGSKFAAWDGPSRPGVKEAHGAFVTAQPVTSAEFLVLLDVGCRRPNVLLEKTSTGRRLTVGGQVVTLPN